VQSDQAVSVSASTAFELWRLAGDEDGWVDACRAEREATLDNGRLCAAPEQLREQPVARDKTAAKPSPSPGEHAIGVGSAGDSGDVAGTCMHAEKTSETRCHTLCTSHCQIWTGFQQDLRVPKGLSDTDRLQS
jgi:hypothetical protein